MPDINDLKMERGDIITTMNGILATAEAAKRDLTGDETKEFDRLNKSQEAMKSKIARIETVNNAVAETSGLSSVPHKLPVGREPGAGTSGGWRDSEGRQVKVYAPNEKIFNGYSNSDLQGLTAGSLIAGAFDKRNVDPRIRNALSVGTGSAGGFTVPEDLTRQLIDNLRNQSRVIQAGARTVMLNTDVTTMARLATDPTAAWRAENASVAESDPTFENVSFTAKSLAVSVKVSNELLQDSVNIEEALNTALTNALALEIDRVCLVGSGASNEPEGIHGQTNVQVIDQGTNGSAITNYTELLDAMEDLDESNVADSRGVILAPREWRTLQGFVDADNNPLTQPSSIASLPFYRTNQAPIDQTKGTSTDASTIFVGDWSNLMIGMRQDLEISINPFLYQGNLQTGFFATMRADIQLAHPEAFVTIDGVVP